MEVTPNYNEQYVAQLFDQMGPSYDAMNLITSFGFSEIWRAQCVRNLNIPESAVVADLMAGSGECWPYLKRRIKSKGRIVSVDISQVMCNRQRRRIKSHSDKSVEVRCENALATNIPDSSMDYIISAFGLKTFDSSQTKRLATEMFRILKPGGSCSLLEISIPNSKLLQILYRFYIGSVIPLIGQICLKNIDCYKMLGVYSEAFGSCARITNYFRDAGFKVYLKHHFFGCASSLILEKAA